jgi:hypothetical protein
VVLFVVISKADGPKVARITSTSTLDAVLFFLNLLGADGWKLYAKGAAMLELNRSDLYLAVGPRYHRDLAEFLEKAKEITN